jgi:hypothetical protein
MPPLRIGLSPELHLTINRIAFVPSSTEWDSTVEASCVPDHHLLWSCSLQQQQ